MVDSAFELGQIVSRTDISLPDNWFSVVLKSSIYNGQFLSSVDNQAPKHARNVTPSDFVFKYSMSTLPVVTSETTNKSD